jgi:hypothetical protein
VPSGFSVIAADPAPAASEADLGSVSVTAGVKATADGAATNPSTGTRARGPAAVSRAANLRRCSVVRVMSTLLYDDWNDHRRSEQIRRSPSITPVQQRIAST